MKQYNNLDRTASLKRLVPDLYDYKTVLYVGARKDRHDYLDEFADAEYCIDVVEIWEPNVDWLYKSQFASSIDIYHIDIALFYDKYFKYRDIKYDVVFWGHGPEHASPGLIDKLFLQLDQMTSELIVLLCPWGVYKHGPLGGNPHEIHWNHLDYPIFEQHGYEVECLGKKNHIGSNITAVKRVTR